MLSTFFHGFLLGFLFIPVMVVVGLLTGQVTYYRTNRTKKDEDV